MSVAPEFCTLFDRTYLTRGLVLYRSLRSECPEARLRVFCMDEETRSVLESLALPGLLAIPLATLEAHDAPLASVKPTRSPVEYCWTATPAICLFVLETEPELEAITYLDADLMFFASPQPLLDELGDRSVLITPHRYAPRWARLEPTSGTYNVQFLTFRRSDDGLQALRWWRDRCLEWCYARPEDGKLGDQKYLDDWPERFEGVHVLRHPGGGLAPWNVEAHSLAWRRGQVEVDGEPLVFFHYQALHLVRGVGLLRRVGLARGYRRTNGRVALSWTNEYAMGDLERRLVWEPYLVALGEAFATVRSVRPGFAAGLAPAGPLLAAQTARRRGRRVAARARGALRRLAERRRAADPPGRYRDSWKDAGVAAQMQELTRRELADPASVAPFRAFVRAVETILERCELPRPARVLDFGCGVGHYSELLERWFPGRFEYTGCDYAPAMVEAARREFPGREFVVNDLFDNALDLGAYDVLLAGALLDVVPDHGRGLEILLGSEARFVILHRQHLTSEGRSGVAVVPGYDGQTTYRSILSEHDLRDAARRHAREIVGTFEVQGPIRTVLLVRAAAR